MAKDIKPIVLEWTPTENSGNLRGLFAIQVGPCEFRKLRLVQQPGQSPFCTPPQETYTDKQGQKRFVTLVKWPAEWSKPILEAMLKAQEQHPFGIKRLSGSSFGDEVRSRAGLSAIGGQA